MHFDGTVTLGNVLTIAAMAIVAITYGIRVDLDLKSIKEWIKGHKECNDKQIAILTELRGDLRYLKGLADGKRNVSHVDLKDIY